MSQLPSMPMWWADFFNKTTHLSREEKWVYVEILAKTWLRNCKPFVDDDVELANVLGMTVKRWQKIRPKIAPFFDLSASTWVQKHLLKVFEKASEKAKISRTNGALGGRPVLHKNNGLHNPTGSSWVNPAETQPITNQSQNQNQEGKKEALADAKAKKETFAAAKEPAPINPDDFDGHGSTNSTASPDKPPLAEQKIGRRRAKTRIPADWAPSHQDREYARARGLDPNWLLDDFVDYWTDPDVRNPLHSDWSRVWQRRCRDLEDRHRGNGVARSRPYVARDQGVVAVVRELIAEAEERELSG